MNVAALCAGIGGLERAVSSVWPTARLVWTAEADPQARRVLRTHWPAAAHYGRFGPAGLDDGHNWEDLPRVDLITAGFPCQDVSYAGLGAGITGARSSTFFAVAEAVGALRPGLVVVENVAALRARSLGVVVQTLASLGYVGAWCSVRASDIGAPHRRERIFLVAAAADPAGQRRARWEATASEGGWLKVERSGAVAPDPDRQGWGGGPQRDRQPIGDRTEHQPHGNDAERLRLAGWGRYAAAVERWERITGELAPDPVVRRRGPWARPRLNPELARWMMGFPPGWLDPLPRTAQLRCIGNAVCPPQGAEGIRRCLDLLRSEQVMGPGSVVARYGG